MLVSRNAVLACAVTLATTLSLLASDKLEKQRDNSRPTNARAQTPKLPTEISNAPKPIRVDAVARPKAVSPTVGSKEVNPSSLAAVRGFGPDCPELDAPLRRVSSSPEHGYYLFAKGYEIEPEIPTQVRISGFSLVLIHRDPKGVEAEDEIVTLRAKTCTATFGHKIDLRRLGGPGMPDVLVLRGKVVMTNNLGTADPNDDIELTTDKSARIDVRRRRLDIRGPGRIFRGVLGRGGESWPRETPVDWDIYLYLQGDSLSIFGNVRRPADGAGTYSVGGISGGMDPDYRKWFPSLKTLRKEGVLDTAPDGRDGIERDSAAIVKERK